MPFDLTSSFADDYLVVDNIETVTLTTVRGSTTTNTNFTNVPREPLTTAEVTASGGIFAIDDETFHLSVAQAIVAPLDGDKITDSEGVAYHIISGVTHDEYRLNYKCVCRKDR